MQADEVMCLDAIGEGPFGTVFEGRYRGSTVAVKKMKMTAQPLRPAARKDMEMELEVEATRMGTYVVPSPCVWLRVGRLASDRSCTAHRSVSLCGMHANYRLRHPNTVLFMGACVQGEYFCVVSEFCTRGSLFDVLHPHLSPYKHGLDKAPLSRGGKAPASAGNYHSADGAKKKKGLKWSLQLRLALGAAKGLLYLHSADPPLVHGQLKSSNILVDDSWNAKLADFGTRRVADAMGFDRSRLESMDTNAGLLRWTAPELLKHGEERVLKGSAKAGTACPQAVDVYSFGMVLWELTTGEVPFAEMQSNREIREYVLSGCRPMMKPGQCNLQWGELITRCWSHNASRRPSAAEIVTTLESISKTDAKVKKEIRVVNSNRTEYRFDPDKPRSRTNGATRFKSNVRLPPS